MTNAPRPTRRGIAGLGVRSKAKGILAFAFATLLACAGGCARQQAPLYNYDGEGARQMFKRVPKDLSADRIGRVDAVGYVPAEHLDPEDVSEEQRETIRQYGPPEHIRKPFTSQRGEKVDEWLYRRSNYLVQWIGGRKVYEGEVTDLEKTLLTWGYPKFGFISRDDTGIERQTWIYDDMLDASRHVFSFSNGKLVGKEGSR